MRKFLTAVLLLFSVSLFAQSNAGFLDEITDKVSVTIEDAVKLYVMIIDKKPGDFDSNVAALKSAGLIKDETINKSDNLRRGLLASMIARHLKLGDSIFYMIFGTERYAYTACVAAEIMDSNGSEWDVLSGGEVVEILTRVSDRTGGAE
jgi:hypothetical protein